MAFSTNSGSKAIGSANYAKLVLFKLVFLPVLIDAAESLTVPGRHVNKINCENPG